MSLSEDLTSDYCKEIVLLLAMSPGGFDLELLEDKVKGMVSRYSKTKYDRSLLTLIYQAPVEIHSISSKKFISLAVTPVRTVSTPTPVPAPAAAAAPTPKTDYVATEAKPKPTKFEAADSDGSQPKKPAATDDWPKLAYFPEIRDALGSVGNKLAEAELTTKAEALSRRPATQARSLTTNSWKPSSPTSERSSAHPKPYIRLQSKGDQTEYLRLR